MRLNPFSRAAQDDSDEEEQVMRHKRPTSRGRRMDAPDFRNFDDDDGPRRRPSQGGGRPQSRSRSRNGRAMTPDARRFQQRGGSPPSRNNERGRDPTPGRSRRLSAASDNRSSSPEIERRPSRRGSAASRASRRSRASHTYPLTSSDEEDDDAPRNPRRRMPPGKQYRGPPGEQRERPMRRRFEDDNDGARSRGRVVPASSMRRSRSRGASNSDDEEEGMMPHQRRARSGSRGPPRNARSRSRDPRQSLDSAPLRKNGMKMKPAPTPKNKKNSWGFKMASPAFGRRKNKDDRDDEDEYNVEIASDSEEENNEPNFGGRRRQPPMTRDGRDPRMGRDPPHHHGHPRPSHPHQQAPPAPVAKAKDHFVVAKREKFANLYQYDNFPAIDRVPTAIGYRSDDSNEEAGEKTADDNGSVTSRYTVDVKSVRGSKLKKNKRSQNINLQNRIMDPDGDDNFSHDENDDKYAQYTIGTTSNAVVSDSDESCVPTWHPALDADESDWYEDDEATMKNMKEQQAKNKKYQVSDSKAKSNKKKKGPVSPRSPKSGKDVRRKKKHQSDEEPEPEAEENKGDAIVANRSEASDMVPNSSRHPGMRRHKELRNAPALGDEESEDERTEGRPSPRRRNQRGGRNRRGGGDEDQDDETEYQEEEETSVYSNDYTEDRSPKKSRIPPRPGQNRMTPANGNSVQGRKNNMMSKGKSKTKNLLKNKFKFRRGRTPSLQDQDASSSEDESSEITGSVHQNLPPTMSMYSEVPSPRKAPSPRKTDPALAKLELDEIKESTATHNMIRNNRKELLELDEMDDASIKEQPNTFACGAFPFAMGTGCFLGPSRHGFSDDIQLDSIQMQRLKDAKHELVNKPKVEVILQNLQDPLVEKYEQLEKQQKKQQREAQREKQAQQEIERREHEELLRQKKEMRETEQKKFQLIQNKDQLALQEAPDLSRGKNSSFVMDISDWVLNLDNNDPTPTASRKSRMSERNPTPRSNGRDGGSSPVEKLPFSEIEVPTAPIENETDDHLHPPAKTQQGWQRKKKRFGGNKRQGPHQPLRQQNGTPATQHQKSEGKKTKKKKGWFRR